MIKEINIANKLIVGGNRRFALIAGPCAIESEKMTMEVANELKSICKELNIDLIFKSSFDKANRSSAASPRGIGIDRGLQILKRVKDEIGIPVLTDVHESWQCKRVADVVDIIQIPAFLSRQTDLLIAAAKTGKPVHIKKGQFMAPWDMRNVIDKMLSAGNEQILLGERGSCFGYNNLIVDMTSLVEMRNLGYPVVFDATHAVQKPGGQGTATGGNREMVPYLMHAALAVGVDVVFAEVHPDPDHAFSDGPNQIQLSTFRSILSHAIEIDNITKKHFSENKQDETSITSSSSQTSISTKKGQPIKLLITDIDGVLTDGGLYYTDSGEQIKKFNAHDGLGLQSLKAKGIKTGFITSDETQLIKNRFDKLKLDYLYMGVRNGGKLSAAKEICAKEGITLQEVAYIGDDLNCLELLSEVGLAACPQNAIDQIKQIPDILILSKKGGEGCVRELIDYIF